MKPAIRNSVLLFLFSACTAVLLTLTSTAGLRCLIWLNNKTQVSKIDYQDISGSLFSGQIDLWGVSFDHNMLHYSAKHIALAWQPAALLQKHLLIDSLRIDSPNPGFYAAEHATKGVIQLHLDYYTAKWPSDLDFALHWQDLSHSPQGDLSVKSSNNRFTAVLHSAITTDLISQHNLPLSGHAEAVYSPQGWQIKQFSVTALNAVLKARGKIHDNWDVNYQLQANDLTAVHPKLAGSLTVQGSLKGKRQQPLHKAKLQLKEVYWDNHYHIDAQLLHSLTWQNHLATGSLKTLDATVRIPLYGLVYRSNNLEFGHQAFRAFHLQGDIHSASGKLSLSSSSHEDGTAIAHHISLLGDHFLLANTPEAILYVSPKIKITHQENNLSIKGEVHVPKALIQPRELSSAVKTSSDVVIVDNSTDAAANPSYFPATELAINLNLGEEIVFKGFNLHSAIRGQLNLQKKAKQLAVASGELLLSDGRYSLYGNEVQIDQGKLIYNHSPLDNPVLAITATRDIALSSTASQQASTHKNSTLDTGKVGVQISGPLQTADIQLISEPLLPEQDQLSYLLLGVPSNQLSAAQGTLLFAAVEEMANTLGYTPQSSLLNTFKQWSPVDKVDLKSSHYLDEKTGESKNQTALVLGKQLSPKLYLNYTIGLINPVNVLQVQFKLNRHWRLQSETSSQGQGGGDLIYSIDK